jgi:hypothetical protein
VAGWSCFENTHVVGNGKNIAKAFWKYKEMVGGAKIFFFQIL